MAGVAGAGGEVGLDLPFTPSNVDVTPYHGKVLQNFSVSDWSRADKTVFDYLRGLKIDTSSLKLTYYDYPSNKSNVEVPGLGTDYIFEAVAQTQGGPEVAVLVVNSLTVATERTLTVVGSRPLILIAATTISLQGDIFAESGASSAPGGGSVGNNGVGPGGGKAGLNSMYKGGAGGGAFCSPGGRGGHSYSQQSGGSGGTPYGTPSIVPLQGGSSGAAARLSGCAGKGGGAIQLVAGVSITIDGYISAPGTGGCEGYEWGGSGGGSGGAILIEAPEATLNGILAVNGGGGGADHWPGEQGKDSSAQAFGGSFACMGHGAAADKPAVDGADDAVPNCDTAAGGGGGGGWIRINTSDGTLAQGSGAFSPAQSTNCATVGTLAP